MRILLIAGHGDGDPGAIGNGFHEADKTRAIVRELKKRIKGATVEVFDMSKNCVTECRKGRGPDFSKHDYVCEIHLNSSTKASASGTMCYIDQSETGHSVEDAILRNMMALGYKKAWDGVVVTQRQFNGGLVVQNACRRAGVSHTLLETCFISNKADMDRLNTKLAQTAQAIADGIMEGFGLKEDVSEKETTEKPEEVPTAKPAAKREPAFAKSFDASLAGEYVVESPDGFLALRYEPGVISDDNLVLSIPTGKKVRCYGYYTKVGGIKWLFVAYEGETGFTSKVYLK